MSVSHRHGSAHMTWGCTDDPVSPECFDRCHGLENTDVHQWAVAIAQC